MSHAHLMGPIGLWEGPLMQNYAIVWFCILNQFLIVVRRENPLPHHLKKSERMSINDINKVSKAGGLSPTGSVQGWRLGLPGGLAPLFPGTSSLEGHLNRLWQSTDLTPPLHENFTIWKKFWPAGKLASKEPRLSQSQGSTLPTPRNALFVRITQLYAI